MLDRLDTSPLKIPFRVNFVMESLKHWRDVAEAVDCPNPDSMPQRIRPVDAIWIAQTYMRLRRRGQDVRLTDSFVTGEACVTLGAARISNKPHRAFTIGAQTHLLKPRIVECNIVQNELLLECPSDYYMIHWPQPGLVQRDPLRGTRIERIGYFGDESLSGAIRNRDFAGKLADMGMSLNTPAEWNDCSDSDVILAVRNVPPEYTRYKPPSKLINAWAAGCPALLGPEQAFEALRKSPLDYFEMRTPGDVLAALRKLKDDPALYRAMVENGLLRSRDFTADAVARQWEELLAGPIAERYRRWLAGPRAWRTVRNGVNFAVRSVRHKKAQRAVDRFNLQLKQPAFDWGHAGGASMPEANRELGIGNGELEQASTLSTIPHS
jgi:hypothetical protein